MCGGAGTGRPRRLAPDDPILVADNEGQCPLVRWEGGMVPPVAAGQVPSQRDLLRSRLRERSQVIAVAPGCRCVHDGRQSSSRIALNSMAPHLISRSKGGHRSSKEITAATLAARGRLSNRVSSTLHARRESARQLPGTSQGSVLSCRARGSYARPTSPPVDLPDGGMSVRSEAARRVHRYLVGTAVSQSGCSSGRCPRQFWRRTSARPVQCPMEDPLVGLRLGSRGLPRLASSRGWRSCAARRAGRRAARPATRGKRRGRW